MSYFHPLEVVGRCSETQLQAGDNLNYLIYSLRVLNTAHLSTFPSAVWT